MPKKNIGGIIFLIVGFVFWNINPLVTLICLIISFILSLSALKSSKNKSSIKKSDSLEQLPKTKVKYILNSETMIVHRKNCRYAQNSYSANMHYTDSLQASLSVGYRRCKYCKP